jgi:lactoylglutathione lyase
MIQEDEQLCCYARSDKYWVTDPTGIAWETFHTLSSIPVYGEETAVFNHGACCAPIITGEPKADGRASCGK